MSETSELRQRRGGGDGAAAAAVGSSSISKKKKILIVGGGPAGAATALSLKKRHGQLFDVTLIESYRHPMEIAQNSPKAYVIALGPRGYQSLYRCISTTSCGGNNDTLEDALSFLSSEFQDSAVISNHLARHPNLSKTKKHKARDHSDHPHCIIPRKRLAGRLLDLAIEAGVAVYFQHVLEDIDFDKQIALVQDNANAKQKELSYDMLIGADGAKSKVRTLLDTKHVDGFKVQRIEEDSMEYQVVTLKNTIDSNSSNDKEKKGEEVGKDQLLFPDLPKDTVHAWNNKEYNSICLAFPLPNLQELLFALVLPEGQFDKLRGDVSDEAYDKALSAILPDLPETQTEDMKKQLRAGKSANGGYCVWTSSLGVRNVAIVGDSGHGMWPSLGQGCNCALETAASFCDTVTDYFDSVSSGADDDDGNNYNQKNKNDWAHRIVETYNRRRHADAVAAVDLTYGGMGARQSRGRNNAPISFKLQVAAMMILNKVSFGIVPQPALLRILSGDGSLSYSVARKRTFYTEKYMCGGGAFLMISYFVMKYFSKK